MDLFTNYEYCFDTSAFMRLKERYPSDVFPGLWGQFENIISRSKVVAPYQVYLEIEVKADELLDWAKERNFIFLDPNESQQLIAKDIVNHYPKLIDINKTIPAEADADVIAIAKDLNITVVTTEIRDVPTPAPHNIKKIPDVCDNIGIACINDLTDLFRRENWRFE